MEAIRNGFYNWRRRRFSGMPKFWNVCSIIGWHALQRNVSVAGSHVCLFVPIEKLPHRLLNAAAFLSGFLFVCSFSSLLYFKFVVFRFAAFFQLAIFPACGLPYLTDASARIFESTVSLSVFPLEADLYACCVAFRSSGFKLISIPTALLSALPV